MARLLMKKRGMSVTLNDAQPSTPINQMSVTVSIKKWYIAIFILKYCVEHRVPLYKWPVPFWRYYILKVK